MHCIKNLTVTTELVESNGEHASVCDVYASAVCVCRGEGWRVAFGLRFSPIVDQIDSRSYVGLFVRSWDGRLVSRFDKQCAENLILYSLCKDML